jgi:hypothetical protein
MGALSTSTALTFEPTFAGLSPAKTGRYQDPAMTIDDLARQGSSKP